jgi:hypothetical protein
MKKEGSIFWVSIFFIVTYFLSAFLIRLLMGSVDSNINYRTISTSPAFWYTSVGLTIKLLINILLSFLLLKSGFLFYQVPVKSKTVLYIIVLSANIFLVQLWCEFFFNKAVFSFHFDRRYLQFLFLSINQLLLYTTGDFIKPLLYAFDTINLFEILFWLLMVKTIGYELKLDRIRSFKVVALFYIIPSAVFITVITLINLLSMQV